MAPQVMSKIWRRMIQRASHAVLARQEMTPAARTGREGEEAAYWHLRERGFIMLERNYRPEGLRGEIDLIGWDGDTLVFIEVKTRQASAPRAPEAAVDRDKESHLIAAAREYRKRAHHSSALFRFDVVSVEVASGGNKIEHFRDAFR